LRIIYSPPLLDLPFVIASCIFLWRHGESVSVRRDGKWLAWVKYEW